MFGLTFLNKYTIGITAFLLYSGVVFFSGYQTAREACQEEKLRQEVLDYQKELLLSQRASERALEASQSLEKEKTELTEKLNEYIKTLSGDFCKLSPADADSLRKL